MSDVVTILTALGSLQVGHFLLQIYQMFLDNQKTNQNSRIKELEVSLDKAFKRIDELEKDNQKLHNDLNIVKEENSILMGLLHSQENKEDLIKQLIKDKKII